MDDPIKTAEQLEEVAKMMQHLAKILRGEAQDMTGMGYWRILCNHLGRAMNCEVITAEQYVAFKELSDAEFKRQGGRTSY